MAVSRVFWGRVLEWRERMERVDSNNLGFVVFLLKRNCLSSGKGKKGTVYCVKP
jgi:hypothetical protein